MVPFWISIIIRHAYRSVLQGHMRLKTVNPQEVLWLLPQAACAASKLFWVWDLALRVRSPCSKDNKMTCLVWGDDAEIVLPFWGVVGDHTSSGCV